MDLKQYQNIFYVIINVNSIVQHVNQIKNEIIIRNVNVNVKIIISVKKIKNGILSHALVRIANI